jgi:hypothetical protein
MHFWKIPSSIDLEEIIKNDPPKFKHKVKIDHFYYILNYLSDALFYTDLEGNKGYVNLNSKTIQNSISNYKEYLNYLLKHNIIGSDMKYRPGSKSKGYKIIKISYDAFIKSIPVVDSVVKKNKAKEYRANCTNQKKVASKYTYLTKWFNDKLKIDKQGALQKVEELFPAPTGWIKGNIKGKPTNSTKKYSANYNIDKLANNNFHYSVDNNVGRFHSSLTNLKKELRSFITYDGKTLINIDIKNSQPLLSTILFNENFYKNNKSDNIKLNNIITTNTTYMITTLMLLKTLQSLDNENVNKYLEISKTDRFYEGLSSMLYPDLPFDRKKIKALTYLIFFSNNRAFGQPKMQPKRDFKKIFPDVYKLFCAYKKSNHPFLSHVLQKIESELIINKVCKRISLEKPLLPIFTIHDSVVTIEGNEDYVSTVIKEEMKKLTNIDVSLGYELWKNN